jgi:similar to stage IV sporulation protein
MGMVLLRAKGRELYSFINMLHAGRIGCSGQYCRRDCFHAEVRRSDLPKIREMAQECGVELETLERRTVSAWLRSYRRRIGLIIGALIVLAGSVYFSNVIVTVEVQGNSAVAEEDILAALGQLGVKRGAMMYGINFVYVENELRLMVDGISWAGVHCTGNRVVVEVTETVPKPEGESTRIPCNIVAAEDARITYTSVYDGLLMRKVGDYVPAGSVLVSGVTDDSGHITLHHAMGKIRGEFERTVTFTAETGQLRYVPTGRSSDSRRLILFGLEVPLSFGGRDYSAETVAESTGALRFFGRELPVAVVSRHCAETALLRVEFSREELRDILAQKIYLYEKNFLAGDTVIISRDIAEEEKESSLVYTVTYTLEGDIGEQREIFIK